MEAGKLSLSDLGQLVLAERSPPGNEPPEGSP